MLASTVPTLYVVAALALIAILGTGLLLWLMLGHGPRRSRLYRKALRQLHADDWQPALTTSRALQQSGKLSTLWAGRLRNLEGECLKRGGDEALRDQRYEEAVECHVAAAELLNLDARELRNLIIERMLGEVRRGLAAPSDPEADDRVEKLVARVLAIQPSCAEALFWRGLNHAAKSRFEAALESFEQSAVLGNKRFIDPPLYQGAVLLRQGKAQQALRCLGDANRVDNNCPFVAWQLGSAILVAGGDANLALRALQRAVGPRGLMQWLDRPDRAWVDGLPEGASFVRRLASKYTFHCPLFGTDVRAMARQVSLSIARAHLKLGNFAESAAQFEQMLGESPPTPVLLQGLGVALALQERYDEAFKHLRTALEQEEPKTPQTGGYLALCGALGKPSRPEDKARNVLWAIRLLSRFDIVGDVEWTRINNQVFAEARSIGMAIPLEDQQRLMKILVSVNAADIVSAQAILHFAGTQPTSLRFEHACLYCRAVQQHGLSYPGDLQLFGLLLRNEPAARDFYAERGWDLDEVAFAYLERCAAQSPGRFPSDLGPDFPARGERMLIERSCRQLEAGQNKSALAAADVLVCLAPQSAAALDWLAQLCYRQGDLPRAASALRDVQQLRPKDCSPALRLAIIAEHLGDGEALRRAINYALAVANGPARTEAALLGARLLLRSAKIDGNAVAVDKTADDTKCLQDAARLLEECLRAQPGHVDACWQLAGIRALLADQAGLAELAPHMERRDVEDARFHYLGAVCQLACGNWNAAVDAARRAARDPSLEADAHYLQGLALLHVPDRDGARTALEKAATSTSRSAEHARALLGRLCFQTGQYDQAVQRWQAIGKSAQTLWKLDEPLRSTLYLTALQAFSDERYEFASERFREAAKQGLRERKLGPLISLSLVKAGEKLLFAERNGKRSRSAALERS